MSFSEQLFVYGSWCKGGPQFQFLEPYIQSCREGYLIGQCWRTEVGYPVYIEEGFDPVPGQILSLQGPALLWQLLDDFHGIQTAQSERSLFSRRTKVAVDRETGESLTVLVFALNSHRREGTWRPVLGGDWRAAIQESPPLPERMTTRQKDYIKRLGRSTNREIVPINLDLYRELIKLKLIVDKGRRLALSPLGRDVLRYLSD